MALNHKLMLGTAVFAVVTMVAVSGCNKDQNQKSAAIPEKSEKKSPETAKITVSEKDAEDQAIAAERAKLNPEDRLLVDAQEWCPSSKDRLGGGGMGVPVKVMVNGEPIFVCCDGCKAAVTKNPEATLAKVKELKAKKQAQGSSK